MPISTWFNLRVVVILATASLSIVAPLQGLINCAKFLELKSGACIMICSDALRTLPAVKALKK